MNGGRRALLAATIAVLAAVPDGAAGQPGGFHGSVRTIALVSTPAASPAAVATLFNRLRVGVEPELGELAFDVAYELAVTLLPRGHAEPGAAGEARRGDGPRSEDGDWLGLQWTGTAGERVSAQHRLDRLRVIWSPADDLEFALGRQAVSWGTTLLLTPADPFVPFHPADRFREYRRGIDALRARLYPSPLSEIDLVVRPSRFDGSEELSLLGRGLATTGNWELSAWAGTLHGDASAAAGASGALGDWAVRFEGVVRKLDEGTKGRAAVGIDRTLALEGGDLGLVVEYQRDGLGAARSDEFAKLFGSREFRRGELQVFGRDEAAVRISFRPRPHWEVSALALVNLNNESALVAPGFVWSPSDEAAVEGVVYFDAGERVPAGSGPPGAADAESGLGGFVSLTWYF